VRLAEAALRPMWNLNRETLGWSLASRRSGPSAAALLTVRRTDGGWTLVDQVSISGQEPVFSDGGGAPTKIERAAAKAGNDPSHVPVLLLQGHHPGGAPWSPDALRAFLASQRHLGAAHEQSEGRLAPLSGSVVTQMEHPVLRIPCCCVDPCETAALMATVLGASVDGRGERLDYISAWWSILAPLVGAASRSEWYARSPS